MTHWYTPPAKKKRQTEHNIQLACVRWFRYTHPALALNLFAVPNGGARDATTGAMLKAEGATAGVADLLLLAPSHDHRHHALCIEMKTTEHGSTQRASQALWQQSVEAQGYRYELVRDFDTFCALIADHLGEAPATGIKSPAEGKKRPCIGTLRDTAQQLQAIAQHQDTTPPEK